MTAAELLSQLRHRDVKVWANGDRLRFSASPGALTPALRDELAERKAEILRFLQEAAHATGESTRAITPVKRDGASLLSFAQQRLWFLNQLEPGSAVYNIPDASRLRGPLNEMALAKALNEIVRRHEVLRTVYPECQGQPLQQIAPPRPVKLEHIDLTGIPERVREAQADRLATEEVIKPFDLAHDQLLRALLIKIGNDDHILLLTMHHIASDGWSLGVIRRELAQLYEAYLSNESSPLPELPIQYGDFAHWQRSNLSGEVLESRLAYWRKQLSGQLQPLELPCDHPRPTVQSYKGRTRRSYLSADLVQNLKAIGLHESATFFMTLLAVFKTLMYRYTEQEDLLVGTPTAGRDRAETEGLIGFFVNTIVLRTDLSGNPTFRELLRRVRDVSVGAFAHQDLPFEKLAAEINPERNRSRTPLFQTLFALQSASSGTIELPGLRAEPYHVDWQSSKFDLSLFATEDSVGGCQLLLEYCTDLFETETIDRMLGHFRVLIESICRNPDEQISQLPMLTAAEQNQLVFAWNETTTAYPRDKCVHQLFEEQVDCTPDAVALLFGTKAMTYRELNESANRVAHHLMTRGVKSGDYVGLCFDRSFELIIAILGILKAGAAYVPLDPTYPKDRLLYMIEDAGLALLVGQHDLIERLPVGNATLVCPDTDWEAIAHESNKNPACKNSPTDLAYIMYTSGSTGQPKGVMIPHRGIVRLVKDTNYVRLGHDEVFLLAAPIAFDASTFEIWGALLNGARVAIPPAGLLSLRDLSDSIAQFNVTTMWLTSGLFHLMTDTSVDDFKKLRQLLAGGDILSVPHVRRVLENAPNCRLINGYGPTESTTFSCCHTVANPRLTSIPIGRPISNTQVYILDRNLAPVPIGVPGELYIGGDGLAVGYLNKPDLTAERFVANPFRELGNRLYKTGDRVRYLADGTIEFFGRMDNQVKIRGFRIELDEISAALNLHPEIRDSVAIVHEPAAGDKRLIAYYVSKSAVPPPMQELKTFLSDRLPTWTVPSLFIHLESMPLSANGKIDRRALPAPDLRNGENRETLAPRNPIEAELVQIWEELLKIRPVGIRDSFFELGGHSLLAVRMMSRVEQVYGKKVPLSDLFTMPTIEHLAQAILRRSDGDYDPPLIKIQTGTNRPFFFLHGDILGGGLYCWNLTRHLDADLPFYALTPQGLDGQSMLYSIEAMAQFHLGILREVQPVGPYSLGGTCNGAMVAFEMARKLQAAGEKIETLILIDAWASNAQHAMLHTIVEGLSRVIGCSPAERVECFLRWRNRLARFDDFLRLPFSQVAAKSARGVSKLLKKCSGSNRFTPAPPLPIGAAPTNDERAYVLAQYKRLLAAYVPRRFKGHIDLLLSSVNEGTDGREEDWKKIADSVDVYRIPGEHATFTTRNLPIVAAYLNQCLTRKESYREHNRRRI
jgi:amino acid adenylation domain-containing protein